METRCEVCGVLFSPGQLNCTYCGSITFSSGRSEQNRDDSKKIAALEDRVKYLDAQLCLAREEREKVLETIRIAVGSLNTFVDSIASSMISKVGRPIVRVSLKKMAELKTNDAFCAKIRFEEYRRVVAAVLLDVQENWSHTTIEPTNPAWVEYKQEILG
jgi:Lhr-like helicase